MKVHAWKTDTYNRSGLIANLRMNGLHAVVHPEALGETDGYMPLKNLGANSRVAQNGQRQVRMKRLDAYNVLEVHLVKVDTEGFEFPILREATETLKKHCPKIFLELHRPITPDSKEKCMELPKTLGYDKFTFVDERGSPSQHIFCS